MLQGLGEKIARLFGEGDMGLNLAYQDISTLDLGIESFAKYLPYDTFDPQSELFLNRGTTGFVLMGTPVAGATFKDQDRLDKFFSQNGNLPEGSSMQFLLIASPKIGDKLDYWRKYRVHPNFQKLADRRYEFLKNKAFDPIYPVRDFKVMISYTLPTLVLSSIEKENLINLRKNLQGALEKIGLFTRVTDDKSLVREVGNIVNFKKSVKNDECWWSDVEELSRLIPAPDMAGRVSEDGFYLRSGETVVHTFLPRVTPKHWALAHMDKLFGDLLDGSETIPCPFLMHYGFVVCEKQGRQKLRATGKRESLERSYRAGLSKWQPGVEQEFEEASAIVAELQKGERIVDACLSLTTFCSPSELPKIQRV